MPTHIFYRHVGLISDRRTLDGLPFVISNSTRAGELVEEPLGVFAGDQPWRIDGYPGPLHPWQVIARAHACQRRSYDALTWNCENFVNYCHALPETSGQVVATLVIAALGAVVFGAAARA
ncbi:MAG: lecithin retinol acyltransferase family protein [Rhizomicrobium sp.]